MGILTEKTMQAITQAQKIAEGKSEDQKLICAELRELLATAKRSKKNIAISNSQGTITVTETGVYLGIEGPSKGHFIPRGFELKEASTGETTKLRSILYYAVVADPSTTLIRVVD